MKEWKTIELAKACSVFTDGNWIEKKDQDNSGIRLIQTGNIGSSQFKNRIEKARYISIKTFKELKCKQVFEGDCLISRLPDPVGRACIIPNTGEDMIAAVDCTIARFKEDIIHPKFFIFYSQTQQYRTKVNTFCTGTTRKRISRKNLGKLPIPVPPLSEQKRIVEILDKAFEGIDRAIANTEKNLANAREIFDNYLNNIFVQKGENWINKKLGDICYKVEYGTSSKSQPKGKIPVLRMGNLQKGYIDWGDLVYTSNQEEIDKYILKHNDVLFNRTNSAEHVGKTAIYKSEQPAIFAGYLIRIHYKPNLIDGNFLNFYLNSYVAREYGRSVMSRSVNQANISGTKLKNYPISFPSISEQKRISNQLNSLFSKTQRLETIYQQKLQALQELKQSILHKAFTGELTNSIVKDIAA